MTTFVQAGIDPGELLEDVGDRIRAERQSRGWTQGQLGERCGMSQAVVSWIERGRGVLPLGHLAAICRGLGVQMSALLSGEWTMPPGGARELLTRRQAEILRAALPGLTMVQIADRLGTTQQVVSGRLSESYRLLGVAHFPRGERRAAAVRAAERLGLLGEVPGPAESIDAA